MLERWMANDPEILGSDTDVLKAIADGALRRRASPTPTTSAASSRRTRTSPSRPVWADQKGRGTHVNLSGVGVVEGADKAERGRGAGALPHRAAPAADVRAPTTTSSACRLGVETTPEIAQFGSFKRDPIDVAGAGRQLDDAVRMMNDVGWD